MNLVNLICYDSTIQNEVTQMLYMICHEVTQMLNIICHLFELKIKIKDTVEASCFHYFTGSIDTVDVILDSSCLISIKNT